MIFALGVLTGIVISALAVMWFLKDFKVYR